jgi:predicted RNase H-like HicB family nuclease
MKSHKYDLNVYWSPEDRVFVAEVPDLPGCMAHGPTRSDAVRSVEQAIELWIDTARNGGLQIPNPGSRATGMK